MTLEETIIEQGIASDAAYAGRLLRDIGQQEPPMFASALAFCVTPYLSLFVYESFEKLQATDKDLASPLKSDVQEIVARSRHSLKLFEDKARRVDGQLDYFHNEVLAAHSRRFLGNTWLPFARRWETDLGLFSYDGKLITTTHAATFHLGMKPDALLKMKGLELQPIFRQYGRYLNHFAARLDGGDPTFARRLDAKRFNSRIQDVRAQRYYDQIFDGAANPDINVLLSVFQGMMNVADSVMAGGQGDIEYTAFKLPFLTLYQIINSLRILRAKKQSQLSSKSVQTIERITDSAEAQLLTGTSAKRFRNTLMHYNLNLDPRVDRSRVGLNDPLFGLVPIYFPGESNASLSKTMAHCISETAAAMNAWNERKTA